MSNSNSVKLTSAYSVWGIFMVLTIVYGFVLAFIGHGGGAFEFIFNGLLLIWTSPALLPSDYIAMAGIGPAFVNSGLAGLLALAALTFAKLPGSGPQMGAFGLIMGFGLFGKNPLNMLPIIIGAYLYSIYKKEPFKNNVTMPLFATCLGPVVSQPAHTLEIINSIGTFGGVIVGAFLGLFIGFIINSVALFIRKSHEGLNLYNIGWGAGLTAIFITMIYNVIGFEPFTNYIQPWTVLGVHGNGAHYNAPLYIYIALTAVFFFTFGIIAKGKFDNLKELLYMKADDNIFFNKYGAGYTYLAMGFLAILALIITLPFGVHLNGAIVGAIISMIGWGGFGKAVFTSSTIIAGVILGSTLRFFFAPQFFQNGISFATYFTSQSVIWTSAFWGTCLSPMVKRFGWKWGIIVGAVHFFYAFTIAPFHWSQNLYNNGLAAGFVCLMLIPIIRATDKKGKFAPDPYKIG
ncbi:MAG: DUF1576 domain-containing protein [Defluviitaleaceae bacterium]|nr:DUF1576 domain-containing protein [Defluviitaleaceae bacterium]